MTSRIFHVGLAVLFFVLAAACGSWLYMACGASNLSASFGGDDEDETDDL